MPGGWGSWNLIGWGLLAGFSLGIAFVVLSAIVGLVMALFEWCHDLPQRLRRFRCRNGWHAESAPWVEPRKVMPVATMVAQGKLMRVTNCRHCRIVLSCRDL